MTEIAGSPTSRVIAAIARDCLNWSRKFNVVANRQRTRSPHLYALTPIRENRAFLGTLIRKLMKAPHEVQDDEVIEGRMRLLMG